MILSKDDFVTMYFNRRAAYVARQTRKANRRAPVKRQGRSCPAYHTLHRTCCLCHKKGESKKMHESILGGKKRFYCDACWPRRFDAIRTADNQTITHHRTCTECGIVRDGKGMRMHQRKWVCPECFERLAPGYNPVIMRTCKVCGQRFDRRTMHAHYGETQLTCDACWTGRRKRKKVD